MSLSRCHLRCTTTVNITITLNVRNIPIYALSQLTHNTPVQRLLVNCSKFRNVASPEPPISPHYAPLLFLNHSFSLAHVSPTLEFTTSPHPVLSFSLTHTSKSTSAISPHSPQRGEFNSHQTKRALFKFDQWSSSDDSLRTNGVE